MIDETEFNKRLGQTKFDRYKSVNEAWTLVATYPVAKDKTFTVSVSGDPKAGWPKMKHSVTRRLYEQLAQKWGFYGDVTKFIK